MVGPLQLRYALVDAADPDVILGGHSVYYLVYLHVELDFDRVIPYAQQLIGYEVLHFVEGRQRDLYCLGHDLVHLLLFAIVSLQQPRLIDQLLLLLSQPSIN